MFRDADLAQLFRLANRRASVTPNLLAHGALVAVPRRGERRRGQGPGRRRPAVKGGLGDRVEERLLSKSMFQVLRPQLILHNKVREVFVQGLRLAREKGYMRRGREMRASLDTMYRLRRDAAIAERRAVGPLGAWTAAERDSPAKLTATHRPYGYRH